MTAWSAFRREHRKPGLPYKDAEITEKIVTLCREGGLP